MKNKDGVADLHLIEVDVLDLGAPLAVGNPWHTFRQRVQD
jgi:hypothetical protein